MDSRCNSVTVRDSFGILFADDQERRRRGGQAVNCGAGCGQQPQTARSRRQGFPSRPSRSGSLSRSLRGNSNHLLSPALMLALFKDSPARIVLDSCGTISMFLGF